MLGPDEEAAREGRARQSPRALKVRMGSGREGSLRECAHVAAPHAFTPVIGLKPAIHSVPHWRQARQKTQKHRFLAMFLTQF